MQKFPPRVSLLQARTQHTCNAQNIGHIPIPQVQPFSIEVERETESILDRTELEPETKAILDRTELDPETEAILDRTELDPETESILDRIASEHDYKHTCINGTY
ncbi:MAG: hypothetical protein MUE44_28790 [Oscillatoriaceae cyanobacterium Prado104]|jgi:hypothetical protein|nr:hypothetical protein [Oscillatoriaceae cyanobacterium Prado104]